MKSNFNGLTISPPKGPDPLRSVQKTKTINLGDKNNLEAIAEEDIHSNKRNGGVKDAKYNKEEEILDEAKPKPQINGTPSKRPGTVRGEHSPEFKYKIKKVEQHPTNLNYGVFLTNDSNLKERLQDASVILLPKNKSPFGTDF